MVSDSYMFRFFQGDLEASMGLPFSPLCDRQSTQIAQSQIGFIDFIVEPTLLVCGDMMVKMVEPLVLMPPPDDTPVFNSNHLGPGGPGGGGGGGTNGTSEGRYEGYPRIAPMAIGIRSRDPKFQTSSIDRRWQTEHSATLAQDHTRE